MNIVGTAIYALYREGYNVQGVLESDQVKAVIQQVESEGLERIKQAMREACCPPAYNLKWSDKP